MIKILNETDAKKIWNDTILTLSNANYYQSYEYANVFKEDRKVEFIYSDDNNKKIYGFVKINENDVKMPFGPILSSNVTHNDLMNFIIEISNYYKKNVIFSAHNQMIEDVDNNHKDLESIWFFKTPLIDTTLSIDEIVRNSTENRRRIIKKGLINIPSDYIHEGIEYLDDFYKLYLKRMKETNGDVDFTYKTLSDYLKEKTSRLVVCIYDKKVIASHIVFSFGDTLITRYNCFDSEYAKLSPSARIEYELIKKSCEDPKIHNYDMSGLAVGTDLTEKLIGINRYKESYNPTKVYDYKWYRYLK